MAFEYKRGTDQLRNHVEAVDIFQNILYYGDSKGFIYLNEISFLPGETVFKEIRPVKVITSPQTILGIRSQNYPNRNPEASQTNRHPVRRETAAA